MKDVVHPLLSLVPISFEYSALKVSANKNAILVFAFQTPQNFTHFRWTFTFLFADAFLKFFFLCQLYKNISLTVNKHSLLYLSIFSTL